MSGALSAPDAAALRPSVARLQGATGQRRVTDQGTAPKGIPRSSQAYPCPMRAQASRNGSCSYCLGSNQ